MNKTEEIRETLPQDADMGEIARNVCIEYESQQYKMDMTIEEAEMLAKERDEWDKIGEAAKIICDAVNGGRANNVAKALYIGMGRNHRTLQNAAVAALVEFLKIYSDTAHDLRNWSAVVAAKRITQVAEEEGFYFPVI